MDPFTWLCHNIPKPIKLTQVIEKEIGNKLTDKVGCYLPINHGQDGRRRDWLHCHFLLMYLLTTYQHEPLRLEGIEHQLKDEALLTPAYPWLCARACAQAEYMMEPISSNKRDCLH